MHSTFSFRHIGMFIRRSHPRVMVLCLLFIMQFAQSARIYATPRTAAPPSASLGSLLGLDDLAKQFQNEVDGVIDHAQGAVLDDLKQLKEDAQQIIDKLEGTYKDLLTVSFDQLNDSVQRMAEAMADQLDKLNTALREDIQLVSDATIRIIHEARQRIGSTISQFQDAVINIEVVTVEGVDYILDKALWGVVGAVSALGLLVGCIAILLAIIQAKGLPRGLGGWVVVVGALFIVFLGSLLSFVPSVRAQVLVYTGKGFQARIVDPSPAIYGVDPDPVVFGQDAEMTIAGARLQPKQGTVAATLNGNPLDIHGMGSEKIVVAAPVSGKDGTEQLTLMHSGTPGPGWPVNLLNPTHVPATGQIIIRDFSLAPSNPVASLNGTGGDIVHASLVVENIGDGTSKPFVLRWIPVPGDVKDLNVSALPPHSGPKPMTFPDGSTYPHEGSFHSEINSDSKEMASAPILSLDIQVRPPPPTPVPNPALQHVTVQFTTGNDDKDADTEVFIVIDQPRILVPGLFKKIPKLLASATVKNVPYHDGSVNLVDLTIAEPLTENDLRGAQIWVSITPHGGNGHDTWRFKWAVDLKFEGYTPNFDALGDMELTQDRTISPRQDLDKILP